MLHICMSASAQETCGVSGPMLKPPNPGTCRAPQSQYSQSGLRRVLNEARESETDLIRSMIG